MGLGREYLCVVCKTKLNNRKELCERCAKKPLVHVLDPACDVRDIVVGEIYQGKVSGLANFGAFVDLTESVRGLAHNKYLKTRPETGDTIFVTVRNILPNGNIELEPAELKEYNIVEVEKELPLSKAADLQSQVGKTIMIKGEVIQVKQTGGPTIFTVADDSGLVFSAAFERAGQPAFRIQRRLKILSRPRLPWPALENRIPNDHALVVVARLGSASGVLVREEEYQKLYEFDQQRRKLAEQLESLESAIGLLMRWKPAPRESPRRKCINTICKISLKQLDVSSNLTGNEEGER